MARPLKGDEKRERTSITLPASQLKWLAKKSREVGLSRSELIEQALKGFSLSVQVPVRELRSFCNKHHIHQLSLFGSVLTDRFSPESDIDVLVEFKRGKEPTLLKMSEMESELSALFGGRAIDLRTYKELSPRFRKKVPQEANVIYGEAA